MNSRSIAGYRNTTRRKPLFAWFHTLRAAYHSGEADALREHHRLLLREVLLTENAIRENEARAVRARIAAK